MNLAGLRVAAQRSSQPSPDARSRLDFRTGYGEVIHVHYR